jgi:hypothetical protein
MEMSAANLTKILYKNSQKRYVIITEYFTTTRSKTWLLHTGNHFAKEQLERENIIPKE